MIKSFIALAVLLTAGFSASACNYIRGSASLTENANSTYTLTCDGQGDCAKVSCNGKDITIFLNGGTIRGTIVQMIGEQDHNDGTSSVEEVIVEIDQ